MVTVPATSIKDVVAGRPIFRPSEAGTRDYVGPDDMAVKYVFVWPFFPWREIGSLGSKVFVCVGKPATHYEAIITLKMACALQEAVSS